MSPKIILLNGTSSSGKTNLLKAVQDLFDEPFLDLGIDQFIFAMPERYLERPLWDDVLGKATVAGSTGQTLISAMHHAILAAWQNGMNIVADHVLVESAWLEECALLFGDLPAWLVGVRCPLDILEQREQSRKNRTWGQARAQYDIVHQPGIYDLELDTSLDNPQVCAQKIHQQVSSGSSPTAFKHLRQYFNEKRAVDPTTNFHVRRDALLDPLQVETLRGAVGWDLMSGKYQLILPKSYAHFSVHADSQLVGFVNVISDGSADAFLVDLMVHPDFQGHGLGYALVRCATQALITDGIRCVEVIFKSHLEKFYRQCGFYIMKSGIIDSGG